MLLNLHFNLIKAGFLFGNNYLSFVFDLKEYELVVSYAQKAMELFLVNLSLTCYGMSYIQTKSYNDAITVLNAGKIMVFDNKELLAQFTLR